MYCKTSLILKYISVCLSLFYIKPLTFINKYKYRYESIHYMHVTMKQRNIKRCQIHCRLVSVYSYIWVKQSSIPELAWIPCLGLYGTVLYNSLNICVEKQHFKRSLTLALVSVFLREKQFPLNYFSYD